jgi:hypothetical protein
MSSDTAPSAVAIEMCRKEYDDGEFTYQCALVAGHGIANCGHLLNGTVVDGHLYATYGEDLSPEIRTQLRLDAMAAKDARIAALTAALGEACAMLDSGPHYDRDRAARLRALLGPEGANGG